MPKPKYGTPLQRSRARATRAQHEREAGIPDRPPVEDTRQPFALPLKAAGYFDLLIVPRLGYVSWRAVDVDTGTVLHCAALKELLHWIADRVPRYMALRHDDECRHGYSAQDEAAAATAQACRS